ncbi:MAG TPA: WYL domain-containing protein [Ignavibacteriales bacterium]|nr:WYL domain-containing protein [Ignavibacteriales bacterium]
MPEYPKRAKILLLLEYFIKYTDERNPKKMNDILDYLMDKGIEAERKAIYSDINLLRDFGYDIVKTSDGGAAYFLGGRAMEIAEAEICASAVSAAKFITQKKSVELINKLGSLFSNAQSKTFRERLELARTLKTKNEEIYYNIDQIVQALGTAKKISFLYFEYMPDKTLQLRREGRRYNASPYSLMWFEDAYYLICNIDKYDNLSHFRLDRMTKVQIANETVRNINEVSEYKNYIDFDEYHRSVFSMFGGEMRNVRIRFRDELATAVYDRFGLDVSVSNIKDGWFTVSVNVRVSPGFLSWLTIFGDKAEVISPGDLRGEIKALAESLIKTYTDNHD